MSALLELENGDFLSKAYDGPFRIWSIKTGKLVKMIERRVKTEYELVLL
jgi:hypothetical protein